MDLNEKRTQEQRMLEFMIQIYCRGNHKQGKTICKECRQLLDYAAERTRKCPFMQTKSFCSACKVHCYAPDRRKKIQDVMRYAGPRMIFYHPLPAILHMYTTLRQKLSRGKNA